MQFAQAHLRLVPCWTLAPGPVPGLGSAVLGCSCDCPQTWAQRHLELATPAPRGQSDVQATCPRVPGPHTGSFLGTACDGQLIKTHGPTGGASHVPGQRARGHTLSHLPGLVPAPRRPRATSPRLRIQNFSRASFQPHDVPGQWARGSSPHSTLAAILASAQGNPGSAWAIARPGRPRKSTGSRG